MVRWSVLVVLVGMLLTIAGTYGSVVSIINGTDSLGAQRPGRELTTQSPRGLSALTWDGQISVTTSGMVRRETREESKQLAVSPVGFLFYYKTEKIKYMPT